jgi:surface antigen
MKKAILFCLIAILCSNCSNPQTFRQNMVGALSTVSGGYLGSKFGHGSGKIFTTVIGSVIGKNIGDWLNQNLDEHDHELYEANTKSALDNKASGDSLSWENPESNIEVQTTINRTFKIDQRLCRDYKQDIRLKDKKYYYEGAACRNQEGKWEKIEI